LTNFENPNAKKKYTKNVENFSGREIHERNTRNDTTTKAERTVMEVWWNNLLHIMNEKKLQGWVFNCLFDEAIDWVGWLSVM